MKWRLPAALLVIGALLVFMGGKGILTFFMPAQDLYQDCDWTKLKNGQRVVANVDFVFDTFKIVTNEEGRDVSAVYAMPDLVADNDGVRISHFMGILVTANDFSTYNRILDASWKWWEDETETVEWAEGGTVYFDGYLRKMDKQEKEFLKRYLGELGFDENQKEAMIIPYVMMESEPPLINLGMFGGGIVSLVTGVLIGIFFFRRR
ncbi:MAG: hypothetical protein K6G75_11725 [Lachnospiraceae bacterium]|nr:hypothetical protein [Lachnospiraceae bacterium]